MGKRVAVCGAIDFNARSTSFKRCILTRSAISKPCMIAAERIPDKYDLIVVYLQPLRAVLLAQFISASSLRGNGFRLAVAQYCTSLLQPTPYIFLVLSAKLMERRWRVCSTTAEGSLGALELFLLFFPPADIVLRIPVPYYEKQSQIKHCQYLLYVQHARRCYAYDRFD